MSILPLVFDTFDPTRWREVKGFDSADITYHRSILHGPEADGRPEGTDMPVICIALDRPDIRNTFRPGAVDELYRALDRVCQSSSATAVVLTGNDPSMRDGGYSFCSGDGQRVRGRDGYRYEVEGADSEAVTAQRHEQIDPARAGHLHILEVRRLIHTMPKVVIAAIPG